MKLTQKKIQKALRLLVGALLITSPMYGYTDGTQDQVKEKIDQAANTLKNKVNELNNDVQKVQNYLDQYHWKGVFEKEANVAPISVKDLQLNGHSRAIFVNPGETVEGKLFCSLNPEESASLKLYQVVIGLKDHGAQATVGKFSKYFTKEKQEEFTLKAPEKPGIYEVRFRPTTEVLEKDALASWTDDEGQEPDARTTIGLIIVK